MPRGFASGREHTGGRVAAHRAETTEAPRVGDPHLVPVRPQRRHRRVVEPVLHHQDAGFDVARVERLRQPDRVERWRVDGLLEGLAADEVAQQERQLPLVLLVAAGGAAGQHGLPVAVHHRRAQRGTRSPARCERRGETFLQPEHLQAGAQREAQLRDRRRTLQPAAARGSGDHVAPAVDNVHVAGVAPGHPVRLHRRLAGRGVRPVRAPDGTGPDVRRQAGLRPVGAPRPQLPRCPVADQGCPLSRVLPGEQRLGRHVRAVAVPRLTVGEGELQRLDLGVDAGRGPRVVRAGVAEGVEDGQRLQQHRALAPEACLRHRVAVPVEGHRFLPGGRVGGHVVAGDESGVGAPAGILERLCG